MDSEEVYKEHGVFGVNFKDVLSRAENGDKLAARDALTTIVFLLSERNAHSGTGKRWPVPDYVRDYLAEALANMMKGTCGDRAFHLKGGPRKWSHFNKRLAADQVFQLAAQGVPVDESARTAADIVNQQVTKNPCPPAWRSFKGQTVEAETLINWYYELKDELTEIHRQAGGL